jgi:predicted N-acetyltransferase YhbS
VEEPARGSGLGLALAAAAVEAAQHDRRAHAMVLVGDLPFFARVGFRRGPDGLAMPGPVDPLRLLWLPLRTDAMLAGTLRPAPARAR